MNKGYRLTSSQLSFLKNNYSKLGPKAIAIRFAERPAYISKVARKLGLYRGIAAGNTSRKNIWIFNDKWTYDIGYLIGVYLGDGTVYVKDNRAQYFRLTVIDKDWTQSVQSKIKDLTGMDTSIVKRKKRKATTKPQYCMTFANKDFASWLIGEFGCANNKIIRVLPTKEANKGMLEGLMDSEGTHCKGYTLSLRMCSDLEPIQSICDDLGIIRGPQHRGIRIQNWHKKSSKQQVPMYAYSISIKEWTRVGLGTYIKRKAKHGVLYKK